MVDISHIQVLYSCGEVLIVVRVQGIFSVFIDSPTVKLHAVEPLGHGPTLGDHAASLASGSEGIMHGFNSIMLQIPPASPQAHPSPRPCTRSPADSTTPQSAPSRHTCAPSGAPSRAAARRTRRLCRRFCTQSYGGHHSGAGERACDCVGGEGGEGRGGEGERTRVLVNVVGGIRMWVCGGAVSAVSDDCVRVPRRRL